MAEAIRFPAAYRVQPFDPRFVPVEERDAAGELERLRVSVLVDLEWRAGAGGHVKTWERLAEAATRLADGPDLTLYFQGASHAVIPLAPHARVVTLRPAFSTQLLFPRAWVPDNTDLAPFHPRLRRRLRHADVIHTTDAFFAYAGTARSIVRAHPEIALVNSIHTEMVGCTAHYAQQMIHRLLGQGALARFLDEDLDLPQRLADRMRRRLAHHLRLCDRVLVSRRDEILSTRAVSGGATVSLLRRGIDKVQFTPRTRDRQRLTAELQIPEERLVLLFAGRIDHSKSVMTLVEAARQLLDQGLDLQVALAGAGSAADEAKRRLGPRLTLPGSVDQPQLAWLYASADLFVFPSRIEVVPNVVIEAKACGLPVIVAPQGGGVYVRNDGVDGVVVPDPSPAAWADAIATLARDPGRRRQLAAAARADVEQTRPSWDDVLSEDLLPAWRAACAKRRSASGDHVRRTYTPAHSASR